MCLKFILSVVNAKLPNCQLQIFNFQNIEEDFSFVIYLALRWLCFFIDYFILNLISKTFTSRILNRISIPSWNLDKMMKLKILVFNIYLKIWSELLSARLRSLTASCDVIMIIVFYGSAQVTLNVTYRLTVRFCSAPYTLVIYNFS